MIVLFNIIIFYDNSNFIIIRNGILMIEREKKKGINETLLITKNSIIMNIILIDLLSEP